MARLIGWAGIGLVVGGILLATLGPPGAGVWAIPTGITVAFFGFFVGAFRGSVTAGTVSALRSASGKNDEAVRDARRSGRLAVARIDALEQTGLEVNDQPMCALELTVQPTRGSAFRVATERIVPVTRIPRFQPGARVIVAILGSAGDRRIEILDDDASAAPWSGIVIPPTAEAGPLESPEDGRRRRAASSPSPRETGRKSARTAGPRRTPLRLRILAVAAAIAVGLTIPMLFQGTAVRQTLEALPEGRTAPDFRRPGPLAEAVAALEREVGHDRVSSVSVQENFVSFDVPLEPGERFDDVWYYRHGGLSHWGPAPIQPKTAEGQFSLAEVAWDRLWPAVEEAARGADLEDFTNATLSVRRNDVGDATGASAPIQVNLQLSDAYRSVNFTLDADGSGLRKIGES